MELDELKVTVTPTLKPDAKVVLDRVEAALKAATQYGRFGTDHHLQRVMEARQELLEAVLELEVVQ
jgi:hypothetical protein